MTMRIHVWQGRPCVGKDVHHTSADVDRHATAVMSPTLPQLQMPTDNADIPRRTVWGSGTVATPRPTQFICLSAGHETRSRTAPPSELALHETEREGHAT